MSLEQRLSDYAVFNRRVINKINFSIKAQNALIGGGTLSYIGGNIAWTQRFLTMASGKGVDTQSGGFIQIAMPAVGTVIADNTGTGSTTVTSSGIPLATWDALYYILPVGGATTGPSTNFRIVNYQHPGDYDIPHNWILVAIQSNDNASVRWGTGVITYSGQSWSASNTWPGGTIPETSLPGRLQSANGPAVTDANNATFSGWWYASNTANMPTTGAYVGFTIRYPNVSGYIWQECYEVNTQKWYWRGQKNGVWTTWADSTPHTHSLEDPSITGILPNAQLPAQLGVSGGYQVTNINLATVPGWWFADSTATNVPVAGGFWVGSTLYYPNTGYYYQQITCIEGTPVARQFWRLCQGGVWYPWAETLHANNIPAQSWTSITGKPTTFTPTAHTHTIGQIDGLGTAATKNTGTTTGTVAEGDHSHQYTTLPMSGNPSQAVAEAGTETVERTWTAERIKQAIIAIGGTVQWTNIAGKPTTFPPSAHSHAIGDLPASVFNDTSHLPNWSEIASKPTTFPPSTHSHTYTDIPLSAAPTQAVAEAGTETVERAFTAQRVRQSTAAYSYSKAQTDAKVSAAGTAAASGNSGAMVQRSTRTTAFSYASTITNFYTATGTAIIPGLGVTFTGDGTWFEVECNVLATTNTTNNTIGIWMPVNGSMTGTAAGANGSTAQTQSARSVLISAKVQFQSANGVSYAFTCGVACITSATLTAVASPYPNAPSMWMTAKRL